ncbi:TPA: hypothetical protein ACH3X1_007911 [Trebouxia sp. C0004]
MLWTSSDLVPPRWALGLLWCGIELKRRLTPSCLSLRQQRGSSNSFDGQGPPGVSALVSEALRALPREKKSKRALIDQLLKVTDSIKSMTRELGGMTVVAEDEYGAMQQLVGLSAQMIHNFERLKQGMYSNVGLPDSDDLHVDPRVRGFMRSFRDQGVHSKLAGPAEGLATEMKTYLLQVWVKLVNNAFVQFLRLCARK